MNFFKKFGRKKILLFILAFIISETAFAEAVIVKKEETKSAVSDSITDEEHKIDNLKEKSMELEKIRRKIRTDSKRDHSLIAGSVKDLEDVYGAEYNSRKNSISFKINSNNFQDLDKFSDSLVFNNLTLMKSEDSHYKAHIDLSSDNRNIKYNKIDISEKIKKEKYSYFKNQNKIISQKENTHNQINSTVLKTDLKEKIPEEKFNIKEYDNEDINISYSRKIEIGEDDIELFLPENTSGEISYDPFAEVFDIAVLKREQSLNPNMLYFKKIYSAKAVSFEIFYNDFSIEEVGVYNGMKLENIEEKRLSDWNRLVFYDIENLEGIFFTLKGVRETGFSVRNIEVYI